MKTSKVMVLLGAALCTVFVTSLSARRKTATGAASLYALSAYDSANKILYCANSGAASAADNVTKFTDPGTGATLTPVTLADTLITSVADLSVTQLVLMGSDPVVTLAQSGVYTSRAYKIDPSTKAVTSFGVNYPFDDHAGSVSGYIKGLEGASDKIFVALKTNGQTDAFGGDANDCIRMVENDDADNLTKTKPIYNAAGASGVQDEVGSVDIEGLGDMYWDATMERLFIGLKLNADLDPKCAVLVGRINTGTNSIDLVPAVATSLITDGTYKIVGVDETGITAMSIYANKLRTMHTTTGRAYLIIQVDNNNNGTEALETRKIFAVPLISGSSTAADNGKVAKKDFSAVAAANGDLYTGNVASDDVPALVGGGYAIPDNSDTSADVTDMKVIGDTVFFSSTAAANAQDKGIYASTAIFDTSGIIQGWTTWARVGGFGGYALASHLNMDLSTGNFWYASETSNAADTVSITRWFEGNTTDATDFGLAALKTLVDTAFPRAEGGVFSATIYPTLTTGLGANAWLIATGHKKVFMARMGGGANIVNTTPATSYAGNLTKTFTDPALVDLGEVYCSEVGRNEDNATTCWLFVGGRNGLAVYSKDADGIGWNGSTGLATTDVLPSVASFKKLAGIHGPVYAMRSDGANLYVMTDKNLWKFAMTIGKFKIDTTPDALAPTSIYTCGTDEYMLCMEATEGRNGVTATEGSGFIGTTKGLYYDTNWNTVTATTWEEVALPTGKGPVLGLKFLRGSMAAATPAVVGNLYVMLGSIVQDSARVYRFDVKGTIAAEDTHLRLTVLTSSTLIPKYDATGLMTNFGALRASQLLNGVGFSNLSKHLGVATLLKSYLPGTSATPTETDATFDLALSNATTDPLYFADLLHSASNGSVIAAGSWGLRVQE